MKRVGSSIVTEVLKGLRVVQKSSFPAETLIDSCCHYCACTRMRCLAAMWRMSSNRQQPCL